MVKNFLIGCISLFSFGTYAQNGTISPYSYFGIGDFRNGGTVENQMMGGLRMYADSIHLNLKNPSAYSQLRLTTYTAGISHREFRLKDATEQQNASVTNLDYLAIGFPIAKNVGIGFGLMPYSSVGYSLNQQTLNTAQDTVTNIFSGEGGLNRAYLSIGFEPIKNLSLGATINYNFGTLDYQRIQSVENVQFGTLDNRESKINGFDFNYALNYTPTFKDKYTLYSHIGINTQVNLVSKNSERIGSFSLNSGEIEVFDVDLDAQGLKNTELKIPTMATIGLGFGENKKWFVGGEYSFQQFSDFSNDFLGQENVVYEDASVMAFGTYFIPDYRSLSGYFKRITYRAGLRYEQTGLVVNNKEINNLGITFGFGLPLGASFSNLNLGFELGRRGTTDAGLIEESYFKINVGLSLNDKWFIKRKIN
ncbi:hypothetical protein [Croceitalea rosinachiae]|uniref:Long-chain fatty acid transport protein n=1 Tax=Croceitalea rosinachiae TaxID=3075596 RepID=A0ABU3A986_9FLAO|nr:hypothetical protein [Croceitalea sp. F388]MDT0606743.1 hypothetical protein [Croceitalea sp. F388]